MGIFLADECLRGGGGQMCGLNVWGCSFLESECFGSTFPGINVHMAYDQTLWQDKANKILC